MKEGVNDSEEDRVVILTFSDAELVSCLMLKSIFFYLYAFQS